MPRSGVVEVELKDVRVRISAACAVLRDRRDLEGVALMIPIPAGCRVWIATGHTDMRRGMQGLALQVQEQLKRDPHAGDLYIFRGRRGDLAKILWHDGVGLSLYAKRLDRGKFIWPSATEGAVSISAAQMAYMLEGIDWRNPQSTWRPEKRGVSSKNLGSDAFWGATNRGICDSLRCHGRRRQSPSGRKRRAESGTRGRAREGVGRHGADRRAETPDRQAGASDLRAAVGALGAARSINWRSRSKSWRRARRKTNSRRNRRSRKTTTVAGFTRKRPERNTFPEHLPRERVVIEAPTTCACCGGQRLRKLGEDVTQTLETTPRQWKVIETVREKFSCRDCEKITQAPAPFHVVARGWAGPSLLAMIAFEKFGQHQPLNRQAERYALEGAPIALSTMADAIGSICAALDPLRRLVEAHVLAAERLHGDDTTVPVLAKGKTDTGRCWVYVRDDAPFGGAGPPAAIFYYSRDRRGEHPQSHLAGYSGILQADAYDGYNRLYLADRKPGPILEAACWSHARRPFFAMADIEANARRKAAGKKEIPLSPIAIEIVRRIDALFAIETFDQRQERRRTPRRSPGVEPASRRRAREPICANRSRSSRVDMTSPRRCNIC